MFGFWIGVNLLLPFLAIYWLINPDFLFYKKSLTRANVALIIFIIALIDIVLLVLVTVLLKGVGDYDVISCAIGIVMMFCVSAWRFYRYGQYSILSKSPKQTLPIMEQNPPTIAKPYSTTQHANNTTENNDILPNKNTIENTSPITEIPIQNMPNNSNSAINQNEQDWQTYKQKMEQSWQETRTKIAQKSGEK